MKLFYNNIYIMILDPAYDSLPWSECSSYDPDTHYDTLNEAKQECNSNAECPMVYWDGYSTNFFYPCQKGATVEYYGNARRFVYKKAGRYI